MDEVQTCDKRRKKEDRVMKRAFSFVRRDLRPSISWRKLHSGRAEVEGVHLKIFGEHLLAFSTGGGLVWSHRSSHQQCCDVLCVVSF